MTDKRNTVRRNIIKIDEEKCNGCGQCVLACAEGAIQIIDGKARLVKDSYCDGLENVQLVLCKLKKESPNPLTKVSNPNLLPSLNLSSLVDVLELWLNH